MKKTLTSPQILDLSNNIITLQKILISSKLILFAQNFKCQQRKTGIWHTEKGNNKEIKDLGCYVMFAIFNYSYEEI